jgi:hypothetical protein
MFFSQKISANNILNFFLLSITKDDGTKEEPRVLGLAMIPGPHIVSIHVDETHLSQEINQK